MAALTNADFKVGEAISIGDTTELRDPDEMTMYSGDAANGDEEEAESGPESGDEESAESFLGSHSSEEEMKGFEAGHLTSSGDAHDESESEGFEAGHLTSSGDAHEESESEGGTIVVLTWRR